MAQQKVIQLPAFVTTLLAALEQRFPGCDLDAEPINGGDRGNYRVAIVTDHFREVDLMSRQKLVWAVVEKVLKRDERLHVLGILTLTPKEFEGEE